jgi:hypothetical protein
MDGHATPLRSDNGLAQCSLKAPKRSAQIGGGTGNFANRPMKSVDPVTFKRRFDEAFIPTN